MDEEDKQDKVIHLLERWHAGDRQAFPELTTIVYRELQRLVNTPPRGAYGGRLLQATVLVHDAFARLIDRFPPWFDGRGFYVISARLIRNTLVERTKARNESQRNYAARALGSSDTYETSTSAATDVLEFHDALLQLERSHPSAASAIELYYFGGLTVDEIASTLDERKSTVAGDIRFAKAWVQKYLQDNK